jgi:autotransporter-associated beta strand protein
MQTQSNTLASNTNSVLRWIAAACNRLPFAVALACLALTLGALNALAETTINVGGAGTIGDTTLTTSGGIATLPDNGDTWKVNGGNGDTYSSLQSTVVTVLSNGPVTLNFNHRWNFEAGFDGGAVYVNINGAGFNKVPLSDFSSNGYDTNVTSTVWVGEDIFGLQSPGWSTPALITSVATLGSLTAGDTVQVEFRGGWDANTFPTAPNWEIGTVQVSDLGGTLLNVNFSANGRSGFTASTTGTGSSPWTYVNPLLKFEINADTLAADRYKPDIAGSVINLNNARIQVVRLTGTLDIGDTFSLFDLSGGTTLSNSIASLSLPGGVAWNTTNLATSGTITVTAITAADGTWTAISASGNNWSDTNKWLGGVVADWIGRTANFTANITNATTITNNTARTIGNITFTDSTTSSHDLTIFGSTGNTLTLDVTTNKPVINVTQSGRQLSINCVLSGTNGFQKNGIGVLNLGGANNYTGTTVANGGILSFGSINLDGFGGGPGSRDILVTASNIIQRTHNNLNNAFLNRLVQTNYEFGVFLTASGAVDVGTGITNDFSSSTGANLPNAFLGSWAGNGGQCRYNGVIIPASDNYRLGFPGANGAMSIIQPHGDVGGTPRGLIVGGGTPVLAGDNTFSGDTVLRAGRLFLGRQLCLQNSALNVGTGTDGIAGQICFLASNALGAPSAELTDQPTLGGLIGSRSLASIYNSANQNNTTRLAITAVLGLTLNVASNKTCTYSGNARLATGMYLTKTGLGTQVLSGSSDYTGATLVSNGTLTVSGFLTNNTASVTVADGATLNVSAHGATPAITSPGDLTLGTSGACTLGFSGLTSTNVAAVNANNVVINGTVTINISGSVGIGQLPLLRYATALSGPGAFVLGSLPVGVTASLVTNIPNQSVDLNVTGAPVGIITDLPATTSYRFVGGSFSLSVVAGGTPPLTYAWSRNGTPVGSNSPTLTLSNLSLGDSGGYSVTVSNLTTGAKSSTNNLVVLPASSYDGLVMASGPVAFWPLNEASGPTAFDYSAAFNGAYSSGGVTYNVTGPVGDKVVTMDGTNGTVTIPYAAALNPSSFSVELWVKPTVVPYYTSNVAYLASSAVIASPRSGWYLAQDDANGSTFLSGSSFIVRLFNQNGTTPSITLAAPVTNSAWNHLVLTYDGTSTEASLYQNGVLASNGLAGFVANVSAPFTVGVRSDNSLKWPGSVGGVALYDRVLSTNEIALHAVLPPAAPSPTLLTNSLSGSTLTFTWPAGQNWRLVNQTNSLASGLNPSTNAWFTVPGGVDGSNSITINPANPTVFYRLVYP